jgi:hypothetical protein
VLSYILDDSFTNSSGHPGANPTIVIYNASVVIFYNARPSVVKPILQFFCAVITTFSLTKIAENCDPNINENRVFADYFFAENCQKHRKL